MSWEALRPLAAFWDEFFCLDLMTRESEAALANLGGIGRKLSGLDLLIWEMAKRFLVLEESLDQWAFLLVFDWPREISLLFMNFRCCGVWWSLFWAYGRLLA